MDVSRRNTIISDAREFKHLTFREDRFRVILIKTSRLHRFVKEVDNSTG